LRKSWCLKLPCGCAPCEPANLKPSGRGPRERLRAGIAERAVAAFLHELPEERAGGACIHEGGMKRLVGHEVEPVKERFELGILCRTQEPAGEGERVDEPEARAVESVPPRFVGNELEIELEIVPDDDAAVEAIEQKRQLISKRSVRSGLLPPVQQ